MKSTKWLLFIGCITLMGCTASYGSKSAGFFQPEDWQEPIAKSSSSIPNSGESALNITEKDFRVVSKSNAGGFQPKFKEETATDGWAFNSKPNEQMSGMASWYGPGFHGKETANGERYNQNKMTAAHKILPMNSIVKVINEENGKSIIIRINDRGPYKKERVIDMTRAGAEKLGFKEKGTAKVRLEVLRYPKEYDHSQGLKPYKQVVVQLAVFKKRSRAESFRKNLSRKYNRIPFSVDELQKNIYHVVAGPYNEKHHAQRTGKELQSEGYENFVRSYRK